MVRKFSGGSTFFKKEIHTELERSLWFQQNVDVYDSLEKAIERLRQKYVEKHGTSGEDDPALNQEIIDVIDEALAHGRWEGGLFFENSGKQLRKLREDLTTQLDLGQRAAETPHEKATAKVKAGYVGIYVSLYLAGGDTIKPWANMINTISSVSVGRPIYREEKDIRNFIRNKAENRCDAYVEVFVRDKDILTPQGKAQYSQDRHGSELLLLREKAIQPENIVKFVHATGEYDVIDKKLVRRNKD